ncbi:MAG: bile acid:sodium symporter [Veillonellales bacterium]
MIDFFTKWNARLGKNMFLIVLSALFLGFCYGIPDSHLLRKIVIVLFAYMTFTTALGTSLKQFIQVLRHPWIPLWVLALVHIAAPFIAWIVGMIFYPDDPYIRLGYLIGASIPIGVTSIIWTSLLDGNMALSLVAVTLDTFLVPLVLPLFFHIVAGQNVAIDYLQMLKGLMLMVTIPSVIGMLLHDWTGGKVNAFANSIGGATSKLAMFLVIFINAAIVMPHIHWDLTIVKTILVTLLIVTTGFCVGYAGSFVLKKRPKDVVVAMIYNVGIRNNACGLVIALSYFPQKVAIPMTLSILFQQPLATIIFRIFKRVEKQ